VICLSRDLAPHAETVAELGYPLVVLPRASSFDVLRLLRLRDVLLRERIDLVHAVHLLASGYVFLATAGARRVAMLPTVRGTVVHPTFLKRRTYRRMFRTCPVTLVNSERGAAFLERHLGAPRERLVIVPNGLDAPRLRAAAADPVARRELGVPAGVPLIGYAGKDSPVKNVPRCIAVLRRLLAEHPAAHALLAGKGLDEGARARLAPDLPRERVHFLGRRLDLPAILADLDLLLLTSESEGLPNVVLEALILGVPVVSSDVGDVAGLIPPGGGTVVPPADVDGYVAAGRRILAARAAARGAVLAASPALEARFGLGAMVASTIALWDRLYPPERSSSPALAET
jgi:glycosyltransferase involved in cell wall biosynthesis